jgi:hypothetical protein
LRLNIAENLAAALDFDLAIADRPRDPASRLDQQSVVDDEVALETASDLSLVDGGGTLEPASSAISMMRQLVSLTSTLPSMNSLSQEVTSPDRVIPRPTLRQRVPSSGFGDR